MPFRATTFLLLVFLSFTSVSHAGGKAGETANVSFHIETESSDNPKMIFPFQVAGQTRYFRRVPEVTAKDIAAFGPFPSDDGQTYGVAFRLKDNAKNRLAAISNTNQGKWLVAQVNGRFVDAVIIDKPVTDGYLIIWKGVTLEEINLYDKVAPRIGAEKKKKK